MKTRIALQLASLTLAGALLSGNALGEDTKMKVLIIDGQNNHNWKATTPVLVDALESSDRFTVEE